MESSQGLPNPAHPKAKNHKLAQEKLANKHGVLAKENSMQHTVGMNIGMDFFVAGRNGNAPAVRRLTKDERLVFIPLDKLEPPLPLDERAADEAAGRVCRAVIENKAAHTKRLAVLWTKPRPGFSDFIDMGPQQWPARLGLYLSPP